MSPELSVIIPTYNRPDYVEACLGSLGACGVAAIEAVVVDDGSTDDTPSRFGSDPRCTFLRQKNQGPAAARNLGVEHSHGRYLAFLDCDDAWLPGVAPKVLNLLESYPDVDAVFTEAKVGNDRDGYQSWILTAGQEAFFGLPHREPVPGFRVLERVPFFRRMARRNAIFLGAMVMRRETFELAGRFDIELCGAADWELWLRMASNSTFGYWEEPLAIYTRHDDNMSSHHDRMRAEFCLALEKVLRKCGHLAPSEREWVRECLKRQSFGLAWDAYDRGETTLARVRFARCVTLGGGAKAAAYWLACCLPVGLVGRARGMKRGIVG